jgi:hypothetical protein
MFFNIYKIFTDKYIQYNLLFMELFFIHYCKFYRLLLSIIFVDLWLLELSMVMLVMIT